MNKSPIEMFLNVLKDKSLFLNYVENLFILCTIFGCIFIIYILKIKITFHFIYTYKIKLFVTFFYLFHFIIKFLIKNVDLSKSFNLYHTFFRPTASLNRAPFKHFTTYQEPPLDYTFVDGSLTEPITTVSSEGLSVAQGHLSFFDLTIIMDIIMILISLT